MRDETRRQRYLKQKRKAKTYPIYLAAINFQHESNLAFIIRSATCFGVKEILLLGSHPSRHIMNELSGSMFDYIDIRTFSRPTKLLEFLKENGIKPIALELPGDTYKATSIWEYEFNFDQPICIITGNETTGVPVELLMNSEVIYIPMTGVGFCLNTSQTSTVALYEAVKQFEHRMR